MILLDTNVIIRRLADDPRVQTWLVSRKSHHDVYAVSSITVYELFAHRTLSNADRGDISTFLETLRVIHVTGEVAKHAAALSVSSRLKIADAIIAATALDFDMALATADRDFKRVKTLTVLPV